MRLLLLPVSLPTTQLAKNRKLAIKLLSLYSMVMTIVVDSASSQRFGPYATLTTFKYIELLERPSRRILALEMSTIGSLAMVMPMFLSSTLTAMKALPIDYPSAAGSPSPW